MKRIWGLTIMALTVSGAIAQRAAVSRYSAAELRQMAQKLEQQENFQKDGFIGDVLQKYSDHYTMLSVRNRTGEAELHEHFSDIFFVVKGTALLTSGGSIVNPKTIKPGEVKGSSIKGGNEQKLVQGDVVHISPNTPHQLTIPKGQNFVYFVVKVKE